MYFYYIIDQKVHDTLTEKIRFQSFIAVKTQFVFKIICGQDFYNSTDSSGKNIIFHKKS